MYVCVCEREKRGVESTLLLFIYYILFINENEIFSGHVDK